MVVVVGDRAKVDRVLCGQVLWVLPIAGDDGYTLMNAWCLWCGDNCSLEQLKENSPQLLLFTCSLFVHSSLQCVSVGNQLTRVYTKQRLLTSNSRQGAPTMAKGLRSKTKQAFKRARRCDCGQCAAVACG